MDFTYLTTIITKITPILQLLIPVIWTSLVLKFFYKVIKK